MRERLVEERGLPPDKVSVVPNWPPSVVEPVSRSENAFRAEHGLEDRFVVMYSDNVGHAHAFDAVLDAAEQLQDERPGVCILFVGDGPRKSDLQRQTARRGRDSVRFLPFQPYERLDESLSAADLHLVTMQSELEGLVVPSKLYGALGAGRPVLFLGPSGSEAARVVKTADCGTVCSNPTGDALADTIRWWHEHSKGWERASKRARTAVASGRFEAMEQFDDLLRVVMAKDRDVSDSASVP